MTIKKGDTVRVSFEGVVGWMNNELLDVSIPGRSGIRVVYAEDCTLVTPPLKVGDIITVDNADRLPRQFVLVDGQGSAWESRPHPLNLRELAPFKLVYIHNSTTEEN